LIYINRDHKVGQDGEEKMIFRKSSGWHICRMSIFLMNFYKRFARSRSPKKLHV